MLKKVTLSCDYIQGFLRNGHFEVILNDEEYKEFKDSSLKKKKEIIKDLGTLVIDSYRVEDYDLSDNFTIKDYGN